VPHHGNADVDDAAHGLADHRAAFDLHGFDGGFLHHASRVAQRLVRIHLERHEWQIADDERALDRGRDERRVVEHLLHRHRDRRLLALHDHRHRIAHENDVDAGLIDELGHREVVGGERGDLLAALLHALQAFRRDLAAIGRVLGVALLHVASQSIGAPLDLRAEFIRARTRAARVRNERRRAPRS
jgi:hypothetical protein